MIIIWFWCLLLFYSFLAFLISFIFRIEERDQIKYENKKDSNAFKNQVNKPLFNKLFELGFEEKKTGYYRVDRARRLAKKFLWHSFLGFLLSGLMFLLFI